MKLRHPFDCRDTLSPAAFKAMAVTIRHSRQQLRDMRENVFRHYECRASALAPREQELHDAMDPSRGKLVADKKILLFAEMCKDAGVHDSGLVDILANGVSLVGTPTSTDQFEEEIRPQAISQVQLMKSSRWSRKKVLAQASRDSSPEIRQAIWEGALAEKDKGWLSGPFTEAQLTEMLGPRFVASRRFGLSQVDKVRPIDDFSASLINSAYTSNYRLDLPGVDGVAIQARSFMEAASPHGISLQGRTLDLDSAYKQIMVAKSSLWASVIVVEDPDGRPSLFISHVLPFGATSAVYAFCMQTFQGHPSDWRKAISPCLDQLHRRLPTTWPQSQWKWRPTGRRKAVLSADSPKRIQKELPCPVCSMPWAWLLIWAALRKAK